VPLHYVDMGLLVQIVKVVIEGMSGLDNVMLLVRLVKSMREMGYEPYMGEHDAEIAGRWSRKVKKDYDLDKHTRGFEGELCSPVIVR